MDTPSEPAPPLRKSRLKKKRKKTTVSATAQNFVDLSSDCAVGGSMMSPVDVDNGGSMTSGLSPGFANLHSPGFSELGKPQNAIHLTEEQIAIVNLAKPPGLKRGEIIRVRAAAGTGKTTTLQQIVSSLASFGHTRISYVTFNKSAAMDAERRFSKDPTILHMKAMCDCKTTHSAAFGSWMSYKDVRLGNPDDEAAIDALIESTLSEDIDVFLAPIRSDKEVSKQAAMGVRKQVGRVGMSRSWSEVNIFIYRSLTRVLPFAWLTNNSFPPPPTGHLLYPQAGLQRVPLQGRRRGHVLHSEKDLLPGEEGSHGRLRVPLEQVYPVQVRWGLGAL